MSERRNLKLPELLARADLIETEVNIARSIVTEWFFHDHTPTKEELRQLGSVLSRHGELTEYVLDEKPRGGVQFNQAKEALLTEYAHLK